jgi:hypothetical protein
MKESPYQPTFAQVKGHVVKNIVGFPGSGLGHRWKTNMFEVSKFWRGVDDLLCSDGVNDDILDGYCFERGLEVTG